MKGLKIKHVDGIRHVPGRLWTLEVSRLTDLINEDIENSLTLKIKLESLLQLLKTFRLCGDHMTMMSLSLFQDECYNYVKVLVPRNDETLFACGTNAFNPTCRNYKVTRLTDPCSPHQNTRFVHIFADSESDAATYFKPKSVKVVQCFKNSCLFTTGKQVHGNRWEYSDWCERIIIDRRSQTRMDRDSPLCEHMNAWRMLVRELRNTLWNCCWQTQIVWKQLNFTVCPNLFGICLYCVVLH